MEAARSDDALPPPAEEVPEGADGAPAAANEPPPAHETAPRADVAPAANVHAEGPSQADDGHPPCCTSTPPTAVVSTEAPDARPGESGACSRLQADGLEQLSRSAQADPEQQADDGAGSSSAGIGATSACGGEEASAPATAGTEGTGAGTAVAERRSTRERREAKPPTRLMDEPPPEAKEVAHAVSAREKLEVGMRVRCMEGSQRGRVGLITATSNAKGYYTIGFDDTPDSGTTVSLRRGQLTIVTDEAPKRGRGRPAKEPTKAETDGPPRRGSARAAAAAEASATQASTSRGEFGLRPRAPAKQTAEAAEEVAVNAAPRVKMYNPSASPCHGPSTAD